MSRPFVIRSAGHHSPASGGTNRMLSRSRQAHEKSACSEILQKKRPDHGVWAKTSEILKRARDKKLISYLMNIACQNFNSDAVPSQSLLIQWFAGFLPLRNSSKKRIWICNLKIICCIVQNYLQNANMRLRYAKQGIRVLQRT